MRKNMKLEITWIGKDKEVAIEPRILLENKELSNTEKDLDTENMLIHGDNLLALKALEHEFAGKIKCIYIDPPYNTGSAFEHFDDNLEHSIWLSLMKPRLEILKNLLSEDGVIAIEIDDHEQAYLKVLCDEIFGRKNFVTMLTIESGEVFGTKAAHINKTFVKVKDYILLYKKNCEADLTIKPLWTKITESFDNHYSNYINNETLEKIPLLSVIKANNHICDIFKQYGLKITLDNISVLMNLNKEFSSYIIDELSTNIFQDQPYTAELGEFAENMDIGKLYRKNDKIIFKTRGGTIRYYKPFSDSLHYTDDYVSEYCRATARGDLWKNYHTDMRNIDDEGHVKFKSSKKSERLIRDLIYSLTNENDWVLDSFLGSGTTMAVAHKMKRKWIGIEMGDHAYSHCKERINKIIDGKDMSGISKRENWQGGGGYKFYELAPTLIKEDDFGQTIINPEYNAEMLASAVAKHEGYFYNPDNTVFWKQSNNQGKSFLYVTTNHVNSQLIETIKADMQEDEFVLIVCKSFDSNCNSYKDISIKKIPQSLLKNCEFGVDNYNLNIICPPDYDEED